MNTKKLIKLAVLSLPFFLFNSLFAQPKVSKGSTANNKTADHSKFKELDKIFISGPEVTKACLGCHTEAGEHIKKTFHWNWGTKINGKKIGKSGAVINNFCISNGSNEGRCTSCHIGYDYKDKSFDFSNENNIDCLVCHDTTGTYKKFPTGTGNPVFKDKKFGKKLFKAVDLKKVAQNIGNPQRHNCLACHANGGGGNGVKHGDTDTSLINPNHALDVHMDAEGLNFSCQNCHTSNNHKISGRYYDRPAFIDLDPDMKRKEREGKTVSCQGCHNQKPHNNDRIDNHTNKVACTSCHIPYSARGGIPTKTSWDWSTAGLNTNNKLIKDFGGKLLNKEGHPMNMKTGKEDTSKKTHSYMAKKGSFTYAVNLKPSYLWYKGELNQMTLGTKINPAKPPIKLNPPTGGYDDESAKIWPFKVHIGKQPYDTKNLTLLPPKLFGKKETGAYWKNFDWNKSLKAGAKYNNIPYSGNYDFIDTLGYWPQKHMVAPKEEAVKCIECHSKNGRLEGLNDFYLIGRDSNSLIEILGKILILITILAVITHIIVRVITKKNKVKGA